MFNLVVTTFRHMETEASSEMYSLLDEIGDKEPVINYTKVSGLLTAKTNMNPYEVVTKIKKIIQDDPWKIRYIQRLIPVDIVVNTDINEIKEAVGKLVSRIKEDETFRITIEKRHSKLSSSDIIRDVASMIDRKVSLDVQDWIVLIEIIAENTGVSIVRPDHIFSSVKIKRES